MAAGVPVWVKPDLDEAGLESLRLAIRSGAAGAWLGHGLFASSVKMKLLKSIREIPRQAITEEDKS
jgi:hypothetical protein